MPLGREHRIPGLDLEVGQPGFLERRHVGKCFGTAAAHHREHAQAPRVHVRSHGLQRRDHRLHMSADEVRDRTGRTFIWHVDDVHPGFKLEELHREMLRAAVSWRRVVELAALGLRDAVATIYVDQRFAAVGGLMTYGSNLGDTWRLVGLYAGRILQGEKPADLPVQQATKVKLVINMKTARALGLTMPLTLLGRADEVIE